MKVWVVDIIQGEYSDASIEKTVVFEDESQAQQFANDWDEKAKRFENALEAFKKSDEYSQREKEHAAIYSLRMENTDYGNREYKRLDEKWYAWKGEQISNLSKQFGVDDVGGSEYNPISTSVRDAEFIERKAP